MELGAYGTRNLPDEIRFSVEADDGKTYCTILPSDYQGVLDLSLMRTHCTSGDYLPGSQQLTEMRFEYNGPLELPPGGFCVSNLAYAESGITLEEHAVTGITGGSYCGSGCVFSGEYSFSSPPPEGRCVFGEVS